MTRAIVAALSSFLAAVSGVQARPAVVLPLAPARYKIQFTVDEQALAQLRRARALMRHRVPDGGAGAIFTHALTLLVGRLETTKLGKARRPCASRDTASGSRVIPAALRREVWQVLSAAGPQAAASRPSIPRAARRPG